MNSKKHSKLRGAKVTYSNGDSERTSLAAHLTDEDILNYYKIGRVFNIGSVGDCLVKVVKCEILY